MPYKVQFHSDFVQEWKDLDIGLKELVGEVLDHIEDDGPFWGRPEVGTLSGSDYANMKEIRVKFAKEVWRFAFAFDPAQTAVILCGGDKQGKKEELFYKQLISKADARFDRWLKEKRK
ncbi:type II toxin-antitoxin system RelE/ParE family toxin [Pararhizobium sp. LjRoot238]|uniref:type II toxin-antitoxin system RelE/ParE family toxin n=1 Tax=Pararhizobium sp. LjRoot238 TaxID=3342293 RepID=UPI003ECDC3FD